MVPRECSSLASEPRGSEPGINAAWLGWGLTIAFVIVAHPGYPRLFPEPDPSFRRLGGFVRLHSRYENVLFFSHVAIPANAPQAVSFAMKRVYLVGSIDELEERVATLPHGARRTSSEHRGSSCGGGPGRRAPARPAPDRSGRDARCPRRSVGRLCSSAVPPRRDGAPVTRPPSRLTRLKDQT